MKSAMRGFLFAGALAAFVACSGCASADGTTVTLGDVLANFALDFRRQVLAAWLI